MSKEKFPPLGDWVTASDVAEELGVSRQSVNRMLNATPPVFKSTRELGKRPIYVVKASEVAKVKEKRAKNAKVEAVATAD